MFTNEEIFKLVKTAMTFRVKTLYYNNVVSGVADSMSEDEFVNHLRCQFNYSKISLFYITKMVQLNNYDQRFNRMNASMKVINSKGGKYEEFQETSKHLLSAIGKKISQVWSLAQYYNQF